MSTKHRTFAVTFRPRDGVVLGHTRALTDYCHKKCDYYHIITEKDEHEKHIHAALVYSQDMTRSRVCIEMKRLWKIDDPDERMVLNKGVKLMYNESWIQQYLEKGDMTQVIASNLPEIATLDKLFKPMEEYFPDRKDRRSEMDILEALWHEHRGPGCEINYSNCKDFMFDIMYNKRIYRVLKDDRAILQTARHLRRYLLKLDRCCIVDPCDITE